MQKPGWKTTEYWATLAAMVVSALMASGVFDAGGTVMQALGAAAGVLAALGYTAGRSFVKGQEEKTKQAKELAKAGPPRATRGRK